MPFRVRLLGALDRAGGDRWVPVGVDHWTHGCPCCGSVEPNYLSVHLRGRLDRADLACWLWRPNSPAANSSGFVPGCTVEEIRDALRRQAKVELLRARREARVRR